MNPQDKIFIAGDTSPVAQDLYRLLIDKGYRNIIGCNSKTLDLLDTEQVNSWFEQHRPEVVFLVAAKTATTKEHSEKPWQIFRSNLIMQDNVFEASNQFGVKKLIYFSSDSALPWNRNGAGVNETDIMASRLKPRVEFYALSKLVGIKQCEYMNREKRRSICTALVPCNIYGKYKKGLIYSLIEEMADAKRQSKREVVMWGSSDLKYKFIHSKDLAQAAIFLAGSRFEETSYIVAPKDYVTKKDLANLIADLVGYKGDVVFDDASSIEQPVLADSSRLYEKGWRPTKALEEGLKDTIDWYYDLQR